MVLVVGVQNVWSQDAQTGIGYSALDSLLNIRVTTASKRWELMEEAPSSVSIVTKEDMRTFGYRTLADVLSAERGFYTSNDRNYAYVGVRGSGRPSDYNNRILLLVNGHAINDAFYGAAPMGTEFALDLDAIDRIEIVRGPGSVLYGSGAMFAVVNIIIPSDADASPLTASAEWGSFDRKRVSFRLAGEPTNGIKGLFATQWTDAPGGDLFFAEFDTDSTNSGVARGRDWDRSVGVFTAWSTGSFSVVGSYFSRRKGVPTAPYETVFNDPRTQTQDLTAFGELKWESDIRADLGLTIRAFVDRYEYEGEYPYDKLYHDRTVADRFGGEVQLRWDLSSHHRLSSGLEFMSSGRSDYHYGSESATLLDANFPFTATSFYVEDEYQIDRDLSIQAGVRYDRRSTVGNSIVPRASLIYHASPSTVLKVLFGEAYRLPNNYELYYEDPLTSFRKSNGLRPERIESIELAIEHRYSPAIRTVVSGFLYRMRDLIDPVTNDSDSSVSFQNVGVATAYGLEMEVSARLNSTMNAYVNYTNQHARDEATSQSLTNVPRHMIKGGLGYRRWNRLDLSFEGQIQSGRLTMQGTWTDPAVLANITAGFEVIGHSIGARSVGPTVRTVLHVQNLFNKPLQSPGGVEHRQAAIVGDGRTWRLGLEISW